VFCVLCFVFCIRQLAKECLLAVHWQTFFALQADVLVVNCYRYTQIFGRIPQNHATARSD
jgi:hypothetical protein